MTEKFTCFLDYILSFWPEQPKSTWLWCCWLLFRILCFAATLCFALSFLLIKCYLLGFWVCFLRDYTWTRLLPSWSGSGDCSNTSIIVGLWVPIYTFIAVADYNYAAMECLCQVLELAETTFDPPHTIRDIFPGKRVTFQAIIDAGGNDFTTMYCMYFVFKFAELYSILYWESETWMCSYSEEDLLQSGVKEDHDLFGYRVVPWCITMAAHLFFFATSNVPLKAAKANFEHELHRFTATVNERRKEELCDSETFDAQTAFIVSSYGLESSQSENREDFKRRHPILIDVRKENLDGYYAIFYYALHYWYKKYACCMDLEAFYGKADTDYTPLV